MSQLNPRKPSLDFNLLRMEDIYQEAQGKADEPHRHDYFTVLFVEQGSGEHIIDYHAYPFQNLEVHFIHPGQVHQVALSHEPQGWVITFTRDFLIKNNIPESFITNLNLFRSYGEAPPVPLDPLTFERLQRIVGEMEECLPEGLTYRTRALGALLQLFLIYCNNCCLVDMGQTDEEDPGVCILRDFKSLLEHQFGNWHKVSDYSDKLHITSKHLSQTVKSLTGKTAKELIQDRIGLEAKRLLLHTGMSVKEVAYQLGFEEPLHFSGFFKKKVGSSPSEYRVIASN